MSLKSRGAPFPAGSDPNDVVAWLDQLAQWVNDRPGVSALTTTQRNALAGADLWDGRLVMNTTTDRLNRYDASTSTWIVIPDTGDIAALLATTGLPAALADTASRGVSSSAARADHVHPWPAWQNYTPTVVNGFTAGGAGASLNGRWVQQGKTVHARMQAILGTGFTMGNGFGLSLPVAANSSFTAGPLDVKLGSAGVNVWQGVGTLTTVGVNISIIGANGVGTAVSSTAPFTWKATDTVTIAVTYEAS